MAATTNVINGTSYILEITEDGGTTYELVAHLTGTSFSQSMDVRETTTKGSAGWRELREGLRSWSASAEGFIRNDAEASKAKFQDLYALYSGRTQFGVRFTNANTGDYELTGDVYITSLEETAEMEDNLSFSVSFEGTGVLTYTAIV